jgi:two-component system response regulator (stage 0 sporulation protein A)
MSNLEKKVDALVRLVLCRSEAEANNIRWELKDLMADAPEQGGADVETRVRNALLNMGVPDSLLGHSYLVTAITMAVANADMINRITTKLYPAVAAAHLTTASRTERAIRHAIEVAWDRGDPEVLTSYFSYTVSPNKGKPTNGEFIARIANVVRGM